MNQILKPLVCDLGFLGGWILIDINQELVHALEQSSLESGERDEHKFLANCGAKKDRRVGPIHITNHSAFTFAAHARTDTIGMEHATPGTIKLLPSQLLVTRKSNVMVRPIDKIRFGDVLLAFGH